MVCVRHPPSCSIVANGVPGSPLSSSSVSPAAVFVTEPCQQIPPPPLSLTWTRDMIISHKGRGALRILRWSGRWLSGRRWSTKKERLGKMATPPPPPPDARNQQQQQQRNVVHIKPPKEKKDLDGLRRTGGLLTDKHSAEESVGPSPSVVSWSTQVPSRCPASE